MKRMLIIAALAISSSAAGAQTVAVTVSEWKVVLDRDTVHAGPVLFKVTNAGTMTHGFYVRGPGVAKGAQEIPAGQNGSLRVTLTPGTYEVYCPLADLTHRAAGMTHQLVVVPAAKAPEKKPGGAPR